jgi:tRNA(Ser,Leu) C12 N-acetylase TAN1
MEWNVLATAFMRKERHLLRFLREYGEFRGSGFRDVIVGKVEKVEAFLEALANTRREHPGRLRHLSQIVPIEKTFPFELSDFKEKLKDAIIAYAEQLENNCRFYVRVKRRGHKGELSSMEIEKEISAFLLDALEKDGKQAQVRFEDPDKFIIVETIGNRTGIGLITRAMRERYPFIRVK